MGERVQLIPVDEVTHVFARERATYAVTATGEHMIDTTIVELERKLDPARVHPDPSRYAPEPGVDRRAACGLRRAPDRAAQGPAPDGAGGLPGPGPRPEGASRARLTLGIPTDMKAPRARRLLALLVVVCWRAGHAVSLAEIPTIAVDGQPYVDLSRLANDLKAKAETAPAGPSHAELRVGRHVVRFTRNWARVVIDGSPIVLDAPVRVKDGRWIVPKSFVTDVLPRLVAARRTSGCACASSGRLAVSPAGAGDGNARARDACSAGPLRRHARRDAGPLVSGVHPRGARDVRAGHPQGRRHRGRDDARARRRPRRRARARKRSTDGFIEAVQNRRRATTTACSSSASRARWASVKRERAERSAPPRPRLHEAVGEATRARAAQTAGPLRIDRARRRARRPRSGSDRPGRAHREGARPRRHQARREAGRGQARHQGAACRATATTSCR